MKKRLKKIVLGISGGISFLLFLILSLIAGHLGKSQDAQMAAARWSEEKSVSQVSCFFSENAAISKDRIQMLEHTVDNALQEASVVNESENPSARLWADAYGVTGTVTISNDNGSLSADAIGIGGDFFLFHPLKLLSGAYFSGNDLMQDYCIIDQDAAWQLFGSNNVAGMTVYIDGMPHIVSGVVERPEGRLEKAAGLDGSFVYLTYDTFEKLNKDTDIDYFEIVMPNPVTGFAYGFVLEQLGDSDGRKTEVIENTTRYSFVNCAKRILEFGTRSMNGKAIIYPYWENIARGYEDILTVITLFRILFFAYTIILGMVLFTIWWRHKGWTVRDVRLFLTDKLERGMERIRARRLKKKKKGKEEELL